MTRRAPVIRRQLRRLRARRQAAVLLEVLLALGLFVAASAIATTALNASLQSLDRQKLATQAINHAASVLAELQIGARPIATLSRRELDAPFQEWSCEIELTPTESAEGTATGLVRAEVIIRHQTEPVVRRLTEVIRINAATGTNSAATTGGAP